MEQRSVSLCITTYNRGDMTKGSYERVIDDPRVKEVIIVDDKSVNHEWVRLQQSSTHPKIRLHRNAINIGVYRNKRESVLLSSSDWIVIFDSDNVMDVDYLNRLYELEWKDDIVYLPSRARPDFNYTGLIGKYTKKNISANLRKPRMDALLNTMNFFVNRNTYLKSFDEGVEPISADSIYMNYKLLVNGCTLEVVKGLEYDHLIHKGSHYKLNQHRSNVFHAQLMNRLKNLR